MYLYQTPICLKISIADNLLLLYFQYLISIFNSIGKSFAMHLQYIDNRPMLSAIIGLHKSTNIPFLQIYVFSTRVSML